MPRDNTAQPLDVGRMRPDEYREVAQFHYEWFARGEEHGFSLAKLGPGFLERVFYRLNVDNPHFRVDVARYEGRIVGFCGYAIDRKRVFAHAVVQHPVALTWSMLWVILRRPKNLIYLLGNLRYVGGEKTPWVEETDGHWVLFAVKPEFADLQFVRATGIRVSWELFRLMEQVLLDNGCAGWYAATATHNTAMNLFSQSAGAELQGTASAQGLRMNYWRKALAAPRATGTTSSAPGD